MTSAPAPDAIFDHFFDPDKRGPAIENLLHGPEVDPYFVTFDPERVVMSEVGFDSPLHRGCGIMPAAILRGYLVSWSVKGGDQGLEALKFHHMVASLSCYARLISSNGSNGRDQCSIFKYYFGLPSIRSMVHFTCVTILKATNTLAKVMEPFRSSPNQDDVINLCASAALDQATKALADSSSWHKFYSIFSGARFAPDIKTRVSCVEAMLKVLSQSREGLLHPSYTRTTSGVFSHATCGVSNDTRGCECEPVRQRFCHSAHGHDLMILFAENSAHLGLHALEDLGFRLYLAGSLRDRQILQPMCLAVIKRKDWMPDQNRLISTHDNAVIHRAYCGLLGAWKRDGIDTKTVPIDFLTNMASFALDLSLANHEYSI